MIEKKIHYCWFGGKKLPEEAIKCIESWKKYCPDFEIIEWNEKNFDISENMYVLEAYKAHKWAFITDYVRLKVLFDYGGIYMDTDVEVKKPLDQFLGNKGFSGFEDEKFAITAIMGCEKGNLIIGDLLNYYNGRHFVMPDGTYDMTTNVVTITNYFVSKGLLLNNKLQDIEGFVLYPKDFFCPKDHATGKIKCTKNTYTIHHFAGSWHTPSQKAKALIKKIIGSTLTEKVIKIKHCIKRGK